MLRKRQLMDNFPLDQLCFNFLKNFQDGRMKIAYLITAYTNFDHLKRLVSALNDDNVAFFIHIDKKSTMPNTLHEFDNVVFIKREDVWWGGWSFQDAIIRLIRDAFSNGFDYYVLLSGNDYPIRPNSFLYNKLSTGDEFISMNKGFDLEKPEDRLKYYYFDCFDRRNFRSVKTVFFYLMEKTSRLFFQKKSYPFQQIYYGPSWWALSHDCLKFVLDQIDNNKDYIRFYKTCWAPDESFFQTIIGNSSFFNKCKTNLTYVDWSSVPYPAWIGQNHIELFKKQIEFDSSYGTYMPFFARKFNDSHGDIIAIIEKELRN